MAIAVVDICNTLADVVREIERELGPSPSPSKYYHPGLYPGFFQGNLWVFKNAEPIPGSIEGVNRLAKNFEIVYLTARPKETRFITEGWLKDHGYPKGEVIFSKDKGRDALILGADLAIDDAPHELMALEKTVPCLLKYTKKYNLSAPGIGFNWIDCLKKEKVSSTAV